MKKVFILLFVFFIAIIAGCNSPISLKDGGIEIKGEDGETIKFSEDGMEVTGEDGSKSVFSAGESVDLPDGYPSGVVPLMEGAHVNWANKSESDNKASFWIVAEHEKSSKEVYNYYLNLMDDVEDRQTIESSGYYTITCEKGGYGIAIVVTDDGDAGQLSSVNINISEL